MFKYVLMSMYFKLFIGFFRKLKKQATTTLLLHTTTHKNFLKKENIESPNAYIMDTTCLESYSRLLNYEVGQYVLHFCIL